MRLEAYLDTKGMTMSAFARVIGESAQTVRRYCLPPGHQDGRIPVARIMAKITAATMGQVTANDFYPVQVVEGPVTAATLAASLPGRVI